MGSQQADPAPAFTAPVLVTGANGYVAARLVQRLLDTGATVHATVRDVGDRDRTGHLRALAERSRGTLSLFAADLLDEGGFDDAMAGCGVVFHTASPFIARGVRDPATELVEPARRGTRNVLAAADRAGSVERVVLTSSVAAIYGDAADLSATADGRFDETHWNTTSSIAHQPYSYSKTVAERTAWEIAGAQDRWTLVAVNPGLVLGPALDPRTRSESVSIMRDFGGRLYRFGAPALSFGVVDVRDVAEAHLRAGTAKTPEGRYILVADTVSLLDIGRILRARFGGRYPFPRFEVPKPAVSLLAPLMSVSREFVARNVGCPLRFDGRRAVDRLVVRFRPVADTVGEHFQQLLDDGLVKRR